jgi:TolA-binding protein
MSTYNPKELSEPDFERSLLDAARVDPLPQNVQIAWANFAGAMRLAASHVEPGSGLHTIEHPEKTVSRVSGEITQGVRFGIGKAATWLIVGAIGGSALTAGLLIHRTGGTQNNPIRAAAQLVPAVSAPSKGNSASLSTAVAPTALVASDAEIAAMHQPLASHAKTPRQSTGANSLEQGVADGQASSTLRSIDATSSQSLTEDRKSSLAAQVRRLDAARTAYRIGAYIDAIHWVEDYHREFPNGVLAPDADVVEIEALVGKQDREAAARRARAFLAKYPNDPHATMVQLWSEP